MEREKAVNYLQRKGKIRDMKEVNIKFNKYEEEKINKVMKEGKIYGDPIAEIQW